jgi:hypothetical protein
MRARYVQHAFKPHAHDYFVLGLIEAGRQSFTHERDHHITTAGALIIINPGEAAIRDGFAYRALYPSADLLLSPLRSSVLNPFSRYLVSWRCNILSRYTGAHHPTIKRNPPLCRPSPTMH